MAARIGREPRQDDPRFIRSGIILKHATITTIKKHIAGIITRAGLHNPATMISMRRHEVPLMNGFRRFWNKTCRVYLKGITAGIADQKRVHDGPLAL